MTESDQHGGKASVFVECQMQILQLSENTMAHIILLIHFYFCILPFMTTYTFPLMEKIVMQHIYMNHCAHNNMQLL